MHIGQAFFNEERPGVPKHLWIVVSDPADASGKVIIVNVSSDPGPENDRTCTLRQGEHRTIVHISYVRYSEARIVAVTHLEAMLRSGQLSGTLDASPGLLEKVQAGFGSSPHVKADKRKILQDQGYIEPAD